MLKKKNILNIISYKYNYLLLKFINYSYKINKLNYSKNKITFSLPSALVINPGHELIFLRLQFK